MEEFSWKLFTQSEKDYNLEGYKGLVLEDEKGQKYRWVKKEYDEIELLEGSVFQDDKGRKYRNIHWNDKTKTLVYEMFHLTSEGKERWEGNFHGRLMQEFMKMKRVAG